ncbi:phosphoribulokinase [Methylomagnum ishizawai]|uniref:phosphoribulokinase n=1 Tax=Methylomagnum ishizawai TaxID=1760988 RepID=A0A1Y6D2I0_9GAMM|nr:phosphoribulokinase [Methylomagnum ishizawai]SMF97159.1 phosphoribulokinase [Methylomagnum ishizawai]
MSKQHPIISITGSSGAGTTNAKRAFERLFRRLNIQRPAIVEGDSFHRYDRVEMRRRVAAAQSRGEYFSHFAIEANLLEELEALFREYGENGTGRRRHYIHDEEESRKHGGTKPGTFTPWEELPPDTDLLFYEGLHGAVRHGDIDIRRYADLSVGIVPIVNLEWIQKIHRDTAERGYKPADVTATILRRMHDYVHVITPQFSETDINFQRVPTVDTSNPFAARDIPTAEESFVIIRINEPRKFAVDFGYLLSKLRNSFMSRHNSIVIPGRKLELAMEIIFLPILERMMEEKARSRD